MSKPGYIYVAKDEQEKGFVKVGQTTDVAQRERALNGQHRKATIKIIDAVWVDDMDAVEKAFHRILYHRRDEEKLEWFYIREDRVLPMLACVGKAHEETPAVERGPAEEGGERGAWHEDGWAMLCRGKTQAEVAKKFGVSQGAVSAMKKKMRDAGRGSEERGSSRSEVSAPDAPQRKQRSNGTPQAAFRQPIVEVLREIGGRGKAKDILKGVRRRMAEELRPADYEHLKNGQEKWMNKAQWARQQLKEEGVLKSDSEHGWWELA